MINVRRWRQNLALALSGLVLATPLHASSYVVGAGDQLYVDFPLRGTPADLQPLGGNGLTLVIVGESVFFRYQATVAPDGFITLPSMNPLRVDGLTLEQVRDSIASHLKSFSLRDTISVLLSRPNSQAFVVSGEVQKPGRFVYERPTTLMEAIVLAGGPTDHAQLKRVQLFRSGQKPQRYNFSTSRLQADGLPDVPILPADTIVVPRRVFTPDAFMVSVFLSALATGALVYAATK